MSHLRCVSIRRSTLEVRTAEVRYGIDCAIRFDRSERIGSDREAGWDLRVIIESQIPEWLLHQVESIRVGSHASNGWLFHYNVGHISNQCCL